METSADAPLKKEDIIEQHLGLLDFSDALIHPWILCKNSLVSLVTSEFNGLVQERCNSIASAMELHLSCINPLIWVTCHILTTRLFVQQIVQANIKETSKFLITGPLWGKSTRHQWFPSQRAGNAENISISRLHHVNEFIETSKMLSYHSSLLFFPSI